MTDNKENQKNGLQFTFRKRYRRVDWKLLSCVDVDRIAQDLDYHALQRNIMNVAFCDTQSQDFVECDPEFIKLYRLGQYTIEYLLHCQEFLSHSGAVLEEKLREAVKFRNEVKDKLESKQRELTEAKKESRKRKKMIAVYQGMMSASGANGFHKCSECDKAFVSASFLQSHLQRRHNITLGNDGDIGVSVDKVRIRCEELQGEVERKSQQCQDLQLERDKAQEQCERALALRDSALEQQKQLEKQYNEWKVQETAQHQSEMASLHSVYRVQVNEALEEKRVAELALVEAKQGIVSNLGALRDEEHEHDELRQEQITELERQFDSKISQLQQEVDKQARRLQDSEETRVKAQQEHERRENKLKAQLEKRAEEEVKLKEVLANLEHENAKLQRLCTENTPVYSPQAAAKDNVEIIQEIISTQPVDVYHKTPASPSASPEPLYTPFKDRPYITCQYDHSTDTLADVRARAEQDLQSTLHQITGIRGVTKLSNEDLALAQSKQSRDVQLEGRRERLKEELSELIQSTPSNHSSGPGSALPPKSPSVRKAQSNSKRQKTSPPLSTDQSPPDLIDHVKSEQPITAQLPAHSDQSEASPLDSVGNFTASTPVQRRKSPVEKESPGHHGDIQSPGHHSDIKEARNSPLEKDAGYQDNLKEAGYHDNVKEEVIVSTESESEGLSEGLSEGEEEEEEEEEEVFHEEGAGNEPSWLESTASDIVSELDLGESAHSAKDYYKAAYNDFDEDSQSYAAEEPEIHTAVKMRPKKIKSKDVEEEESIFSFDGWSKNKARNSMSVADAKENIPMGHVERMRHEVAAKNRARTKHLSVGVSILGDESPTAADKRLSEPCRTEVRAEEDDFTVSSISDIDLSPVGMSVEVKKRGDVSDEEF